MLKENAKPFGPNLEATCMLQSSHTQPFLTPLHLANSHNTSTGAALRSLNPEVQRNTPADMSERFIPEHRRTQFKAKNTFKPDELRRRREEQQVEIRKAKREENLAKRRGITGRDGTQMSAPGASLGASIDSDDEGGTIESQVCHTFLFSKSQRSPSCCWQAHPCLAFHLVAPEELSACGDCRQARLSHLPKCLNYPGMSVACANLALVCSLRPNSPKW